MSKRFSEVKWGDVDAQDSSMPDADGVRTITEYHKTPEGERIKVVRKVKEVKKMVRMNKKVLTRRQWQKFGDCKGLPPGPENNITYQSFEAIHLDLKPKKMGDEDKEDDLKTQLSSRDSIVVCRVCGKTGHWTLRCPERNAMKPPGESLDDEEPRPNREATTTTENKEGKYVPAHRRKDGMTQGVSMGRDEAATLRVTNLSEDVTEQDLQELFRRFGHTTRIFLAKDRNTDTSRGFAFINYQTKEAAQKAIDKLNGHGYDNLILHVEWAKPREEKAGEGGTNRTQEILKSQKRRF